MISIFSLPFFMYSFLLCRKKSVAFYLSVFIGSSLILTSVSPLVHGIDSLPDFYNMIFTVTMLLIVVHSFRGYYLEELIIKENESTLFWPFIYVLIFSLTIVLVINFYIVYKSTTLILLEGVSVGEFKNEGLAQIMIRQWVNPNLVTIANIFSPLGYLTIALHFYFLRNKKIAYSIVFLILSFNLPLSSLHGLSRAGVFHFLLIYTFFFLYIQPSLSSQLRSFFKKIAVLFFGLFLLIFVLITESRFGEDSNYSRYENLGTFWSSNQELLSVVDYGTQWSSNGLEVLENYTIDQTWFGKSNFKIVEIIAGIFDIDYEKYSDVRQNTLGEYASKFLGLIAVLVYDFGYVLATLVIFIFFFTVKYFSPQNHKGNLKNIIFFPILIAVPVMFFTNNYLSTTSLSVGIVLLILSSLVLRSSIQISKKHEK